MGVTANAQLMLGYILGTLTFAKPEGMYRLRELHPATGTALIENPTNGNTYLLSAVQLTGSE